MGQLVSSTPSGQSLSPSHTQVLWMQRFLGGPQENCVWFKHVWFSQLNSSEPSGQSGELSHFHENGIQETPSVLQWN